MRAVLHAGFFVFLFMFGVFLPNSSWLAVEVETVGGNELPGSEREANELRLHVDRKSLRQNKTPNAYSLASISHLKIESTNHPLSLPRDPKFRPPHSLRVQHAVFLI